MPQDDSLARFSLYYTLLTDDGIKIDVVGEGLVAFDETDRAPFAESLSVHVQQTVQRSFRRS